MATPIAAFYESGTPPPSYPLLTVQTDLTCVSAPVATVTTSEELTSGHHPATHASRSVPNHSTNALPSRSPSLGPSRVQKSRARSRSSSPYVVPPPKKVSFSGLKNLEAPESSSDNDEASNASSEDSEGSEGSETLIPKPQGQAGRPNRGGYNLEIALNWPSPLFTKMQKYVHKLIDTHLDITQSYQPQKESDRQLVRKAAIKAFPRLLNYEGCWPVNDLMMLHLKNTARREKLKDQKLTAEAAEESPLRNSRGKGKGRSSS